MNSDDEGDFICGERSEDSKSFGSLEDFIVENSEEEDVETISCESDGDDGIEPDNIFESSRTENGSRSTQEVPK